MPFDSICDYKLLDMIENTDNSISQEFIEYILHRTGVRIQDIAEQYDQLFENLATVFLTEENLKFMQDRHYRWLEDLGVNLQEYCQSSAESNKELFASYEQSCKQYTEFDKKNCLFWELFNFHKLTAQRAEKAIEVFQTLNKTECYLLQLSQYNLGDNLRPAYRLTGEFDFSFINNSHDFEILREDIRRPSPIPFELFEVIEKIIGSELYIFDDSYKWFLILTHERDIFLYQIE